MQTLDCRYPGMFLAGIQRLKTLDTCLRRYDASFSDDVCFGCDVTAVPLNRHPGMFLAGIQRLKTLDNCVTLGFLPSALRAALRAFKIAPGDFVAGMTLEGIANNGN